MLILSVAFGEHLAREAHGWSGKVSCREGEQERKTEIELLPWKQSSADLGS